MDKPVLSICIPTYNRADVLKRCLDSIVNHELAKTGSIEIVVCDNNSSDDTQFMMGEYAQKYPYIHYVRNEENIGVIYNTIKVLDCATGAFRKLLNDYSIFTKEGLQNMYAQVLANQVERPVLLFNNTQDAIPKEHICATIDEIAHQVGIWLTWMGLYGYWEEDWQNIKDKDKYYDKTFTTIDYLLQMMERKKVAKEIRFHYTDGGAYKRKQGGYNFFKVFVQDYLDLWHVYLENGTITATLYKWLKKDLWPFVWMYTRQLLINKEEGNFKTEKGWSILFKYYGKESYFWKTLCKYPFGVIKRKIKRLL